MKINILEQIMNDLTVTLDADISSENISNTEANEIVYNGIDKSASELVETILKNESKWLNLYRDSYNELLNMNVMFYQEGFNYLDLLYYLSSEMGKILQSIGKKNKKKSYAREHVLFRLHAKSLQISAEIICLLKGGFADGALARWRSLYECAVIVNCITHSSEEIAIRFLNHVEIERSKKMKLYNEHAPIHYERFSQEELEGALTRAKKIIDHFGIGFDDDYGWANPLFLDRGKRRITFNNIVDKFSMGSLKVHYKWACEKIHVTTNSLYRSISNCNNEDIMMAGASDNGFQDPVALLTICLDQINTFMCLFFSKIDLLDPAPLVMQNAFHSLCTKTELLFIDLQKQKNENYQKKGIIIE